MRDKWKDQMSGVRSVFNKGVLLLLLPLLLIPRMSHAQGFPAEGEEWSFPTNLTSWSFADTNDWHNDLDYAPVAFTNLAASWMGNIFGSYSLEVDGTNAAWLRFNVQEGDGTTNLTVEVGTVSLWFAPKWASATTNQNGSGPGDWGRLIEVGAYTTNASYGWWSLYLDTGGTNLYFTTQTNSGDGVTVTYLSAPIEWATNEWHNLVLTYSATNTALYLDGELAASGDGVTVFPGPEVLTNGFGIGSDLDGFVQAHGLIDDLYTYDFPWDSNLVASVFGVFRQYYAINIFNVYTPVESAFSEPVWVPEFNAIAGAGLLQWLGGASGCETNSGVWITNVTSSLTGAGLNLSAVCAFTIMGGSEGGRFDVFVNAALGADEPAHQWAWMGQGYSCNSYQLASLPPRAAFIILGTAQDSDFDGLTDAYELLVSHTDPEIWDTDGDGVGDGIEVVQGRNPLVGAVLDTGGVLAFDVFTPLE